VATPWVNADNTPQRPEGQLKINHKICDDLRFLSAAICENKKTQIIDNQPQKPIYTDKTL